MVGDLREQIAMEIAEGSRDDETFHDMADRILALPRIKEALEYERDRHDIEADAWERGYNSGCSETQD